MSRVSLSQMKRLLDLFSEEGVLVNGKVVYGKTNKQTFWKKIATQLNSVERGVHKNTWQWCKMWADWKNKTKKKANIILRRKNYNLEHPSPNLTDLELRLLKMINYPVENKADAFKLGLVVSKVEPEENHEEYSVEFLSTECDDFQAANSTSDDDRTLDSYDRQKNCFSVKNDNEGIGHKKKKKLSLEEYKIRTTLKIEKEKVQQKTEELRLKALELKLKGDELRLKEMEMNKIHYLTNIEEEKLKCLQDISTHLKVLLDRTISGNLRFQNGL